MTGVAVIGCGLIGSRRAAAAAAHPDTRLLLVVDPQADRRERLGAKLGAAAAADWHRALEHPDVDAVVIATPNGFTKEIGVAALEAGRHVLLEKPMGRSAAEARALARAAEAAGRCLKVGFNHRYHPALSRLQELVVEGGIGRILNMRARYGHGSRPGCEAEWRGDPELAGGGELLDQGVHLLDLFHWLKARRRTRSGSPRLPCGGLPLWRTTPSPCSGTAMAAWPRCT
jgi:predicted dehydrogenase